MSHVGQVANRHVGKLPHVGFSQVAQVADRHVKMVPHVGFLSVTRAHVGLTLVRRRGQP